MLFALGFVFNFIFGGLTGVIMASPPLDFHLSDTYFIVAHFHYVVVGGIVFGLFGALYFWWPKWTGKMMNERLGQIHFWLFFIGFHAAFLIQHWLGVIGMPRRYATYLPEDGFTWMNQLSTVGSFVMAVSLVPWIINVYITWRYAPKVTVNDPWGSGRSLEWATACPAPRHNFTSIPRIRSESPAFDLNHPELAPASIGGPRPTKEIAARGA
jgi:cytochrome c oxidase subunit 1